MIYFFLLILAGKAVKEPRPISEEELDDEVSQAEHRSKWLACLSLSASLVETDRLEIIKISQQLNQPYNLVVQKIAGEFLERCGLDMDLDKAAKVLGLDGGEELGGIRDGIYKIDSHRFENFTTELTEGQKKIVEEIRKEISRDDDGFNQQAPVMEEARKWREVAWRYYVAAVWIFGVCVWMIFKIFQDDEVDVKRVKYD